jgi:Aerotolerance regulator N-terminal/von Willebrand factor type A domain
VSFDAPAGLWLLAGIPVIVGLWLLRPRRPRVRIPSVLLWPTSSAERRAARPWQRLRNHPLLWLQLLIACLLAIAAAQPFVPAEAAEQRLIVLLDASGSMRATDVAPSRWDAARAAVVDLATSLGPDQTLSLIRLDDQPRTLLADTRDASHVQAALANEQPGFGSIDASTGVSLAAGLARGAPSQWVLVGDGEFPDLPSGVDVPADTRLRFVSIGSASAGNVAVTSLSFRASGNSYAAQVGIRNDGDADASGTVQLVTDTRTVVANATWMSAAHQETYVAFEGLQTGPAWFEARLGEISPPDANDLSTDDRAWAVPQSDTSAARRVLLVSSGNTFLERVLAVDGNLRTFKIPPADWPALVSQGGAARYPLVVLDRQPRQSDQTPGGSALYVSGESGEAFQPRLIAPRSDHPLVRNVDWSDVRIGRATRLSADELSAWQTVVDSDGGPLVLVHTLSDGNQVRREALLTFELGESDLPLRPAFPVLMANLLDWLVPRPDGSPRSVAPGAALQLDSSPLARGLHLDPVTDSSLPREQLAPPWPARAVRAVQPGVYRAVEDGPDGEVSTYVVAEAFAPSESNLRTREPLALAAQMGQSDTVAQVVRSIRSGVWPWLLAGLLGLAAIEWLVDARGR